MSLFFKYSRTEVGNLKLVASQEGLVAVLWEDDDPRRVPLTEHNEDSEQSILLQAEKQLKEYFAGERESFSLPLDMRGTVFQQEVWRALQQIPFGETRSYVQIASQLGRPGASRAVGAANSRNPFSIIVPCHRVIGSSGKLTGFAGGLHAKAHLLGLETRDRKLSSLATF